MLSIRPTCASTKSGAAARPLGLAASALGAVLALSSAACVDPDGAFDDFESRAHHQSVAAACGGDAGACMPPAVGKADGDFLFALSAKISPTKPPLFEATLKTSDDGKGGVGFSLKLQPLDAKDRKTPVGGELDAGGPYAIAGDGCFSASLPTLSVPGKANPISGTDLEATVTLSGQLCGDSLDFICGPVTGSVSKPIKIADLTGSNFTMQRLDASGNYPDPKIDCAGDPAGPAK